MHAGRSVLSEHTFHGASFDCETRGWLTPTKTPQMACREPRSHHTSLCGASALCVDLAFQLQTPHHVGMKKREREKKNLSPPSFSLVPSAFKSHSVSGAPCFPSLILTIKCRVGLLLQHLLIYLSLLTSDGLK